MANPDALIFMKVGSHAGEDFESILKRKQKEYEAAGCIFWGYGGTTLHPTKHVRPFVQNLFSENGSISLFMQPMESNADPQVLPATEYSEDGRIWRPLPGGISVTGSKYALVLDEIKPGDLDIPLSQFEVGVGPSKGKLAADYIKGRVDKACLLRSDEPSGITGPVKKATYTAKLLDPYAVFLR